MATSLAQLFGAVFPAKEDTTTRSAPYGPTFGVPGSPVAALGTFVFNVEADVRLGTTFGASEEFVGLLKQSSTINCGDTEQDLFIFIDEQGLEYIPLESPPYYPDEEHTLYFEYCNVTIADIPNDELDKTEPDGISFTIPEEVSSELRTLHWSLRRTTDQQVIASGRVYVSYAPYDRV